MHLDIPKSILSPKSNMIKHKEGASRRNPKTGPFEGDPDSQGDPDWLWLWLQPDMILDIHTHKHANKHCTLQPPGHCSVEPLIPRCYL